MFNKTPHEAKVPQAEDDQLKSTSSGQFVGQDTDQASKHDVTKNNFNCNENLCEPFNRSYITKTQCCKSNKTVIKKRKPCVAL